MANESSRNHSGGPAPVSPPAHFSINRTQFSSKSISKRTPWNISVPSKPSEERVAKAVGELPVAWGSADVGSGSHQRCLRASYSDRVLEGDRGGEADLDHVKFLVGISGLGSPEGLDIRLAHKVVTGFDLDRHIVLRYALAPGAS